MNYEQARFNMIEQQIRPWEVLDSQVLSLLAVIRPAVERYRGMGVRIEDDYLVTATGVEWISRAPRELADVEAAMKASRVGEGPLP